MASPVLAPETPVESSVPAQEDVLARPQGESVPMMLFVGTSKKLALSDAEEEGHFDEEPAGNVEPPDVRELDDEFTRPARTLHFRDIKPLRAEEVSSGNLRPAGSPEVAADHANVARLQWSQTFAATFSKHSFLLTCLRDLEHAESSYRAELVSTAMSFFPRLDLEFEESSDRAFIWAEATLFFTEARAFVDATAAEAEAEKVNASQIWCSAYSRFVLYRALKMEKNVFDTCLPDSIALALTLAQLCASARCPLPDEAGELHLLSRKALHRASSKSEVLDFQLRSQCVGGAAGLARGADGKLDRRYLDFLEEYLPVRINVVIEDEHKLGPRGALQDLRSKCFAVVAADYTPRHNEERRSPFLHSRVVAFLYESTFAVYDGARARGLDFLPLKDLIADHIGDYKQVFVTVSLTDDPANVENRLRRLAGELDVAQDFVPEVIAVLTPRDDTEHIPMGDSSATASAAAAAVPHPIHSEDRYNAYLRKQSSLCDAAATLRGRFVYYFPLRFRPHVLACSAWWRLGITWDEAFDQTSSTWVLHFRPSDVNDVMTFTAFWNDFRQFVFPVEGQYPRNAYYNFPLQKPLLPGFTVDTLVALTELSIVIKDVVAIGTWNLDEPEATLSVPGAPNPDGT